MELTNQKGTNKMTGKNVVAKHDDGREETVHVRQLKVQHMQKLLDIIDEEPESIEFYCDKPSGWSKTLTNESFEELIIEGQSVNSDFFNRWVHRRLNRMENIQPGVSKLALQKASELAAEPQPRRVPQPSPA
jgi:hypothetical protein